MSTQSVSVVSTKSPSRLDAPTLLPLVSAADEVVSPARTAVEEWLDGAANDAWNDEWIVRGHVVRGDYSTYAGAPLALRLHAGLEVTRAPFVEVELEADERGRFAWKCDPPSQAVVVEVVPRLEDHFVRAATCVVFPGDPPPDDLAPWACSLEGRVEGRVVDVDGRPVPGAVVSTSISETTARPDGTYVLAVDPTYPSPSIRAAADGFTCGVVAVGALRSGNAVAPDLVLRAAIEVTGRVVDGRGEPVAGATVESHQRTLVSTTTDVSGEFRLGRIDPARDRTYLTVRMDGYRKSSVTVDRAEAAAPLEIVLLRGSRARGRVVTREGEPVPGALVSIGDVPRLDAPSTRTDAKGLFVLEGLPTGQALIGAVRSGYAAAEVRVVLPEDGETLEDVTVVLRSGDRLAGIVVDERGQPVAGAVVDPRASGGRGPWSGYVGPDARSDEDGRFELTSLRKKRFDAVVFAEGFTRLERRVVAGAEDVVLKLERAGALAGRVVDGATGAPIESFRIKLREPTLREGEERLSDYGVAWAQPGMSFTRTSGYWTTAGIEPKVGVVTGIEVSAEGYAPTRIDRAVIVADPEPDSIVVELGRGTRVTGSVIDSITREPLANVRVQRCEVAEVSGRMRYVPDASFVTTTDDRGRFVLESVCCGSMFLMATGSAVPLTFDGPFDVAVSDRLVERTVEVGSGARLHGAVVDGYGGGRPGRRVELVGLELPSPGLRLETTTDANGEYSFRGLVPGLYRVSLPLSGEAATQGNDLLRLIEIGDESSVELDLRPEGQATLSGRLEFEAELPDGLVVSLTPGGGVGDVPRARSNGYLQRRRATKVESGRFSAAFLRPGPWTVRLRARTDAGSLSGSTHVIVPEHGTVDCVLEVRAR